MLSVRREAAQSLFLIYGMYGVHKAEFCLFAFIALISSGGWLAGFLSATFFWQSLWAHILIIVCRGFVIKSVDS